MLNSMMKKLALGVSAAVVAMSSPASAQIVVATTPSFAAAANYIIPAFENYYYTYHNLNFDDIPLISSGVANIEATITGGANTFDIFLAPSAEVIEDLVKNHRKLVVGEPFVYAEDSLELWSASVDISDGLPFPLTTTFLIPNPAEDNYGAAAAQILAERPWRIPASKIPAPATSIPGSFVATSFSVGQVYSSLAHGRYPYGFVARSQICSYAPLTKTYSYPSGSYHHEYKPFDPKHHYDPELVTLTAVKLAKTRTPDQEAVLKNFIAFLTGTRDTFGTRTDEGTAWIESFCFKLPHHFDLV
jgi:molybdate transport system substrate-binding protein